MPHTDKPAGDLPGVNAGGLKWKYVSVSATSLES